MQKIWYITSFSDIISIHMFLINVKIPMFLFTFKYRSLFSVYFQIQIPMCLFIFKYRSLCFCLLSSIKPYISVYSQVQITVFLFTLKYRSLCFCLFSSPIPMFLFIFKYRFLCFCSLSSKDPYTSVYFQAKIPMTLFTFKQRSLFFCSLSCKYICFSLYQRLRLIILTVSKHTVLHSLFLTHPHISHDLVTDIKLNQYLQDHCSDVSSFIKCKFEQSFNSSTHNSRTNQCPEQGLRRVPIRWHFSDQCTSAVLAVWKLNCHFPAGNSGYSYGPQMSMNMSQIL